MGSSLLQVSEAIVKELNCEIALYVYVCPRYILYCGDQMWLKKKKKKLLFWLSRDHLFIPLHGET